MYYYLTDPEIKNIAVLDMTHGGIHIARKLKEQGFNVTGVDIYRTLSSEQCSALEMDGIWMSENHCSIGELDLMISLFIFILLILCSSMPKKNMFL